jgi:hypothetical protein
VRIERASVLLWALLLVGCNSVSESDTDVFTLIAFDWEQGVFLEAVEVCDTDTGRCAMTGPNGVATLEIEAGQRHSITAEKEGYASHLVPNVLENWWGRTIRLHMVSNQEMAQQHGRVGADYPMRDSGTVIVHLEQEYAGATFELIDATGDPFYYDEEGRWSTAIGETTLPWARGGFVNVSEGEFDVQIGGAAWRCIPFNAWPGQLVDSIRFPVRAGYLTVASARCAERQTP